MINFLPLWERGASPALLSSCRCSSWCRSQMEWSQSCQHAPRDVYVPSDPAWSPKSWGNSRHPKTWSSDTGPIESNKSGLWKVSCIMEIAGLLSVSMRHTMRSTGSYIVQSMIFAMSLFFFIFFRTSTLFTQIYYACISLTPLGMRYPPSTKSSCVIRPLPGRTGKSLLPGRSKQRVLFSNTIH